MPIRFILLGRTETALGCIETIMRHTNGNTAAVIREMVDAVVITPYNRKHYFIHGVDFTISPMCKLLSLSVPDCPKCPFWKILESSYSRRFFIFSHF